MLRIGQARHAQRHEVLAGPHGVTGARYRLAVATSPQSPARNRPWTYEEVVLACELVADNGWRYLHRNDPRVGALSGLLRAMSPADATARDDFRNASGVARKTADIATQHENYEGVPTRGGQHDRPVLQAFISDAARMRAEAEAIRQAAQAILSPSVPAPDLDLHDDAEFHEGTSFEARHLARERDPRARQAKIKAAIASTGTVACGVCSFDFQATYGDRGRHFAECHHRNPLSVVGPTKTRLSDLALLCSNCHRMVHRHRPWLTVDQLATLVAEQAEQSRERRRPQPPMSD